MTQWPSGSGSPVVRTVTRGSSRNDTPMSLTPAGARATSPGLFAERHHLDRRVANLFEESIQRRSFPQDLETRARALSKDDMRDPLAFGERDQAVCGTVGFHAHDRGAKTFGE